MVVLSTLFVPHHYSHLTCRWRTISLIVDIFSLTMIEDDIECDNDDDDTLALTVTTALTASCVVMQEHMDKRKHRQKKKKGRCCPFTIMRQRMSILLIRRLLSDPYFKRSYRFSPHGIENLIQCIGPHVVIATTGKATAPNGIIPLEAKLLVMIRFLQDMKGGGGGGGVIRSVIPGGGGKFSGMY